MIKYKYTEEGKIEFREIHSKDCQTIGFIKPENEQALIDSGADIAEYIKPEKTLDDVRAERENLFKAHVDKYNPAWWSALTADQQTKVVTYRLELKDITDQDPNDVTWPTPPSS
jgi:hypothetical protein